MSFKDDIKALNTWILITEEDIPVGDYRPDFLGIYYAEPVKWFYFQENFVGAFHTPPSYEWREFYRLYESKNGKKSDEQIFANRDQALQSVALYRKGLTDSFDPAIVEAFDRLDSAGELPDVEARVKILGVGGEVCVNANEYSIITPERLETYKEFIGNGYNLHMFGNDETAVDFRERMGH